MKKYCKLVNVVIFVVYLGFWAYLLFLAEMLGREWAAGSYSYNLIPFREIKRFLKYDHQLGLYAVFMNLGGNILGFIPFGYFLPKLFVEDAGVFSIGTATAFFSLAIETMQLVLNVGSFDVDDILLNTIGGVLGALLFVIIKKVRK